MFFPPLPPVDQMSRRPPRNVPKVKRGIWRTNSIAVAVLWGLVSFSFFNTSRSSVADATKNEIAIETIELSQLPIPGSVYESTDGITFTAIAIDVAIVSLTSLSVGPGIPLPGPGEIASGESLSNVSISFQGFPVKWEGPSIDSYSVRPADVSASASDVLAFSGVVPSGAWDMELLAMELTGELPGPNGPITGIIRESPTLASLGQHVLTPLPDSGLHINSFFDVFFELSLDGGPFVPADGPVRLDITDIVPEPATASVLVAALVGLGFARRRYRPA